MANWTAITADDLKAAGHGAIVDRARTAAVGGVDPVAFEIENAVKFVRSQVEFGNAVDSDPATVPASLKGLAVRMALFALMERLRLSLTEDQRATRKGDEARLLRIAERKIPVETPDTAGESAVPQTFGNWQSERKILGRTHPVPPPGLQHQGGDDNGYANPDGPEDSAT